MLLGYNKPTVAVQGSALMLLKRKISVGSNGRMTDMWQERLTSKDKIVCERPEVPVERVRNAVAAPCQRLLIETKGNSASIALR